MSKAQNGTEPMDPGVRENAVGEARVNNPRDCWAIKTLVAEVDELFPETTYETSNVDGRNTALDVQFDLTGLVSDDRRLFALLLSAADSDPRVDEVLTEDDSVLVSFKANARTQDDRASFGLSDAFDILVEDPSR